MAIDMSGFMLFVMTNDPTTGQLRRHSSEHDSAVAAQERWAEVRASVARGHRIVEALILPPGARKGDPRVINLLAA